MFDVPSDDSDLDEPVMEPLPQAKFASSREVGPTPARAQTPPDRPDPVAARMAFSAEPREALLARAGFADASADVNAPSLPKSSVSLPPLVAPARGAKNGTPGRVSDPRAKGPAKDFGKAAGGMARFVPMKQKAAKSLPNGGDSAARIAAMSAAIAAPTKVPPAQDLLRQGLGTRPVQQRGKPRYLGLVLTLILIAVLAAAALWATFLQESPAVTSEAPANAPTDTGSTVVTQAAPSAVADATGTDIEAPVPLAPAAASISPDVEVVTGVAPQDPTLQDPSQQNTPLPDAGTQIAGTQDPALPESDQATEPAAEQIVSTTPLPDTVRPLPRPERLASALPTQERAVAAVPAVANAERSVSTASGPVTEAGPALLAALPGASDSGTGSATDVALPHSGPEGTANANLSEPARLGQTSPGQPRLGQSAPDASPLHEAAREAVVVADPAAAAAQTGGEATTLAEPAQGADITPTLPAIATPGLTQLASRAVPAPLVPPQTAENDAKPASPVPPAPFGLFFDRDASGFVIATTDGALTPEGAVVFAGRPKLVPPTRLATAVTDLVPTPAVGADASPAATAIEAAPFSTDTAPPIGADPALSGFRPKLRPASLISPGDQTLTVVVPLAADATTIRPKPRPVGLTGADNPGLIGSTGADQGLADPGLADPGLVDPALADPGTPLQDQAAALDQTKAFASASPLAVAASRRPGQRPKDFTASVTAALAAAAPALEPETAAAPQVASLAPAPRPEVPVVKLAIKPEAAAPAEPQKRAVDEGDAEPELASAAPSIPTKASVAKQATETNAISLKVVNLIGVYGSSADRHALVRLASGKYLRLKVGDRVDGGQVAAIGEQELRYVKNGKNLILALPKEG